MELSEALNLHETFIERFNVRESVTLASIIDKLERLIDHELTAVLKQKGII